MTANVSEIKTTAAARLNRSPLLWISGIFLFHILFRFIVLSQLPGSPSITPDENLYLSLAASLARGDGITLRGQPLNYTAILYPLVLSLLYRLPVSIDVYRAVQLLNCILMCSSVFPAYGIARKLDRKQPVLWAAFSALLPDFILARHAMTEPLLYPLVLVLFYLFLKLHEKPRRQTAVLFGSLCFLIYITKQGAVAYVIGFVLTVLFLKRKELLKTIPFMLGSFLLLFLLWKPLLQLIFNADFTRPSIYQTQTAGLSVDHLLTFLNGSFFYIFYTLIGFGIIPLLLLLFHHRRLAAQEKAFFLFTIIGMVLLIAGTVYIFHYDELYMSDKPTSLRVHLRYLFPLYYPLLLCFASPRLQRASLRRGQIYLAAAVIFLLATLGFSDLISGNPYFVDAALLNSVLVRLPLVALPEILTAFYALIPIWTIVTLKRTGWTLRARNLSLLFLAVPLLTANIATYYIDRYNTSEELRADAREVTELVSGNTLFLYEGTEDFHYILEAAITRMRNRSYFLKLADYCTIDNGSFDLSTVKVPDYWTTHGVKPIEDLEYVVVEQSLLDRIAVAETAAAHHTANGYFSVYPLSEVNRFSLHSGLTGYYEKKWSADIRLWMFDPELLQQDQITVSLEITAAAADTVTLQFGEDQVSYPVNPGSQWITHTFTPDGSGTPAAVKIGCTAQTTLETYLIE